MVAVSFITCFSSQFYASFTRYSSKKGERIVTMSHQKALFRIEASFKDQSTGSANAGSKIKSYT